MKKYLTSLRYIAVLIAFIVSVNCSGEKKLYEPAPGPYVKIVKSGKAAACIVVPVNATETEKYAASELHDYIKKISGASLRVETEKNCADSPYSFYLGSTDMAVTANVRPDADKMGRDGFQLKSIEKGLIIRGMNDLGTLFGVYELLERYFEVRWFMPGSEGEYYPSMNTLNMGQINLVYKPSFNVRWIHQGEWALHQRMNAYVKINGKAVGINWKWGYHTFGLLLPPEKYYDKHPEYYALVKGKRAVTYDPKDQGNQLCTSNPDVIREVAKNLIDTLTANPGIDIINFSPEDNRRFCECENCKALDEPGRDWLGKYTNRSAVFNDQVAKIVKEKFPDVLIKVGAYENYARVPLSADYHPSDNLLFQVCHLWFCHNHPLGSDMCADGVTYKANDQFNTNKEFEKILDEWLKLSKHVFIYEYYQISGMNRANLPWPMIHTMRSDIPWYKNKGVEGFYTQTSDDWKKLGLNFYIASKLCWNTELNVDALIDDYFTKFYGKAAEPAKDFFMTMEKAMQDWNGCASYALQGVPGLRKIAPDVFKPAVIERMGLDADKAVKLASGNAADLKRAAMLKTVFDETKVALDQVIAAKK